MPFGLLGLAAGITMGNWTLGFGLLGLAVLNRVVQSLAIGWGVVRDWRALWFCWLYPVRDFLGFFLWVASYAGTEIVWRGERYQLSLGGKMIRRSASFPPAPKTSGSKAQKTLSGPVTVDHLT
jgi:ceramide glucosyltransferase